MIDYPTKNDKILALAKHDPTVYHALQSARMNGDDWQATLENLVLMLGAEKSRLMDQLTAAITNSMTPAPILLPHGATLIGKEDGPEMLVSMPKLEKGSRVALNDFGTASGNYKVTKVNRDSISLEREQ